ncbi:unnamed protein product [Gadus morhua 'NCC']
MVLLAHELGMGYAALRKQSAVNEGKITVDELDSWREKHTDCAKNFSGSSKAMEQEAARRMWARSVSRHQLRYTEMLSDGDSSAFKENRVEAAASMAISSFNEGASAMLNVMANLWLESTLITVNTIKQADLLRVSKANAIQSATVKRKRKLVSTAKKVERHQQELSEGPTYGAGMDI